MWVKNAGYTKKNNNKKTLKKRFGKRNNEAKPVVPVWVGIFLTLAIPRHQKDEEFGSCYCDQLKLIDMGLSSSSWVSRICLLMFACDLALGFVHSVFYSVFSMVYLVRCSFSGFSWRPLAFLKALGRWLLGRWLSRSKSRLAMVWVHNLAMVSMGFKNFSMDETHPFAMRAKMCTKGSQHDLAKGTQAPIIGLRVLQQYLFATS